MIFKMVSLLGFSHSSDVLFAQAPIIKTLKLTSADTATYYCQEFENLLEGIMKHKGVTPFSGCMSDINAATFKQEVRLFHTVYLSKSPKIIAVIIKIFFS